MYDTLELMYIANSANNRTLFQKKIIAKIKMLDFYLKNIFLIKNIKKYVITYLIT